MTATLQAVDFVVAVPTGWDVRISGTTPGPAGAVDYPVVHAANFPLPAQREDYGGELVATMTVRQVFVALLGYGSRPAGQGLFAPSGLPHPLQADWFDPYQMQRPYPGRAGVQRFFTAQDRAFCLYAVVGGYSQRGALVPLINNFLGGVTIRAAPHVAPRVS